MTHKEELDSMACCCINTWALIISVFAAGIDQERNEAVIRKFTDNLKCDLKNVTKRFAVHKKG